MAGLHSKATKLMKLFGRIQSSRISRGGGRGVEAFRQSGAWACEMRSGVELLGLAECGRRFGGLRLGL
ncbi:Hypothetical predicted protein [Prunus dulcis]|uniref:Uncharacterized protein n=1 Tax=Prunus dulcis TaxID=3755 RepID=A0A5E4F922_PRUDU|nr:Hypothetical predicted protein [Prunus dulcis]